MTQMDMAGWFATPATEPEPARKGRPSIEERFATFHAANPHVLEEMRRLALEYANNGMRRIGAKMLWEELRTSIRVLKLGAYRLDNSLTSLYARALIEAEPSLEGVIETRQRRAR